MSWKMPVIGKVKESVDSLKTQNRDISGYVKTDSYCWEADYNWNNKFLYCLDVWTVLPNEQKYQIGQRYKITSNS